MKIVTIIENLQKVPVLEGMLPEHIEFLSGCTSHVHFRRGEYLQVEREEATRFFAIREGSVALEMGVGNRDFVFHTVGSGDVVGWSWLIPPYRSHYDARAVTEVAAISFDAVCVRGKCDEDPVFGYEVMKRFSRIIAQRLMVTQMLLVDMYK